MDKKHAEEHYIQLQQIDEQIKMIENEVRVLEQRSLEMLKLRDSLKDMHDIQKAKAFSSLGMGIYAESEVKDTKSFLVNVGAGVVLKKSSKETEDLIDKKLKEIENLNSELTQNIQMLGVNASAIQKELQKDLGLK